MACSPRSTHIRAYMGPNEFKEMQAETHGEFGGLGVEVTMEEGLIKVMAPIDDTPAARAGILANDIITQIDSEPVQGMTVNQAVDKLRGPVNSSVKLTIQRKEKREPIEVSLTRKIIQIRPVRARAEGDIGYLRITQFNEQTYAGLRAAIAEIATRIGPASSRATSSTCATTPADCSIRRSSSADAFLDPRGDRLHPRPQSMRRHNATRARARSRIWSAASRLWC